MTRDEIRSLEAGRNFDAMVMDAVFRVPCLTRQDIGDIRYWHERTDGGRTYTVAVPRFSTDINAAWRIVLWLREYWGQFDLCAGLQWRCQPEDSSDLRGSGDTAPLAICRAALLAVTPDAPAPAPPAG